MNIDFLKPVLGDELFAQITEKLNAAPDIKLANVAENGNYIPKAKYLEEIAKVRSLESKVEDLNAQISDANTKLDGMEELNTKIAQLTKDVTDRDGKIANLSRDYNIKDALRAAKARDVDIVFGLLDKDKISTGKDGALKGVDEQVKALQEKKAFLFESEDKGGAGRGGFGGGKQDIIGGGVGNENTNSAVNSALRAMAGRG